MFIKVLNYNIFSKSMKDLLEYIESYDKVNIISGNPEVLYNGLSNEALFKNFTGDESIIIPDGVGTVLASKVLKTPVEQKIAGIELMEAVIRKCEEEEKSVYLIGAQQDILEGCVGKLKAKYKNLNIAGKHNGFFDLNNCDNIIEDIKNKKPYALFVAMGSPRQDMFIIKNMENLPCKIFMGVGGSFDVFAGKVKRAPKWMINLGLEWLYRVYKEPFRIKRLASIPKFLIKVLKYNHSN